MNEADKTGLLTASESINYIIETGTGQKNYLDGDAARIVNEAAELFESNHALWEVFRNLLDWSIKEGKGIEVDIH